MRDPRPVEAVSRLAELVLPDPGERDLVHGRVAAGRDERGHPPDRVRPAGVARAHEQLGVGAHERHGHRHLRPIGQDGAELLDRGEDVVPPPRVERAAVLAELVEDRIHLERRQDRLEENGAADRAPRHSEHLLGDREGAGPEPRLLVILELRQVEVGPAAAREQLGRVVEEREREVEERGRDGLAADGDVPLVEVPAARAHDEHGRLLVQRVALLRASRARSSGAPRRAGSAGRRRCSPTSASTRPRSRT